jgi:hypothetical protein
MKKVLVFRLFAIAFFCLVSLVIRSETSCKSICSCIAKSGNAADLEIINPDAKITDFRNELFFIKI